MANCRKCINQTLFACFIGKAIFFPFFFCGLYSDLAYFTGLAGVAVSLNGESKQRAWAGDSEAAAEGGMFDNVRMPNYGSSRSTDLHRLLGDVPSPNQ